MTKLKPPIFDRLALIGVGLIGGSIARAARAQGAARSIVRHRPLGGDAQARGRAGLRRPGGREQRGRRRRRRSRHRLHPGRRVGRRRPGDRAASEARRHRVRRRLGEGRRAARHGAASARPFISFRRTPSPAPRTPDRTPALRNCSSTAGASSRRPTARTRRRSSGSPPSGARSAPMSRPCRPSITTWCSRSPAICRI